MAVAFNCKKCGEAVREVGPHVRTGQGRYHLLCYAEENYQKGFAEGRQSILDEQEIERAHAEALKEKELRDGFLKLNRCGACGKRKVPSLSIFPAAWGEVTLGDQDAPRCQECARKEAAAREAARRDSQPIGFNANRPPEVKPAPTTEKKPEVKHDRFELVEID